MKALNQIESMDWHSEGARLLLACSRKQSSSSSTSSLRLVPHTTTALGSGALILLGTTPIHTTDSLLIHSIHRERMTRFWKVLKPVGRTVRERLGQPARNPAHAPALRKAPADACQHGGRPRTDVIDGWQRKVINTTVVMKLH